MVFKSLSKKSSDKRIKGQQLTTLEELNSFFEKEFVYLLTDGKKIDNVRDYKFDSVNLAYIFKPIVIEMKTSYKNHIFLNMFINSLTNLLLKKR